MDELHAAPELIEGEGGSERHHHHHQVGEHHQVVGLKRGAWAGGGVVHTVRTVSTQWQRSMAHGHSARSQYTLTAHGHDPHSTPAHLQLSGSGPAPVSAHVAARTRTRWQHTGTAHGHTGTAHRHSTRAQHTGTSHGHSTRAQHTGTAHEHSRVPAACGRSSPCTRPSSGPGSRRPARRRPARARGLMVDRLVGRLVGWLVAESRRGRAEVKRRV